MKGRWQTVGILTLWFLAAWLVDFYALSFWRSFMSWSGGSFDRFGSSWIILKSFWYGLVGLLMGISVKCLLERKTYGLVIALLMVSLIVADFDWNFDDLYDRTPVDRLIAGIGYGLSRIAPYNPCDDPIPAGHKTVLKPRQLVEVTTPSERFSIEAGSGSRRWIHWDGVTRAIAISPTDRDSFRFPVEEERYPGYDWERHRGVTRCQYYESRVNCKNQKAAAAFVEGVVGRNQSSGSGLVCNSGCTRDGLLVSWMTGANLEELTIEVYQVLVNDKPAKLQPISVVKVIDANTSSAKINSARDCH